MRLFRRIAGASRIARDRRGVAMVELAFALPLLLTLGMYGVEVARLALINLRINQIALAAADNASRVGAFSTLADKRLRESDLDDILAAIRLQGNPIDLSNNGRVTVSSLETNSTGGQWIHWQRCIGVKAYESTYGKEDDGKTGNAFPGMGPTGAEITARPGYGVIFVEVNYDYQPVVFPWLLGPRQVNYTASFVVRDKRDFTKIWDSDPATAQTCDKHKA